MKQGHYAPKHNNNNNAGNEKVQQNVKHPTDGYTVLDGSILEGGGQV